MSSHMLTAIFVAILATPTLPTRARASAPESPTTASSPEIDALVAHATTAFDAGDFPGAVAAFEKAYAISPDPRFLYNVGRIHEEAGQLDEAIAMYRRFVAEPGVELEQRERASQRIEVLTRITATITPTEPPPPRVTPTTTTTTPPDDPPPSKRVTGKATRDTGIGLLAGGAGLLAAGAIVGVLAQRAESDLRGEDDPAQRRDLVDRGRRLAVTTDVLLSVGAAIAIVGTVLTATGAVRMRRSRRHIALQTIGPGLRVAF